MVYLLTIRTGKGMEARQYNQLSSSAGRPHCGGANWVAIEFIQEFRNLMVWGADVEMEIECRKVRHEVWKSLFAQVVYVLYKIIIAVHRRDL